MDQVTGARGLSVSDVAQLGRTSVLGVTYIIVLHGMASADRPASVGTVSLGLLAATMFHAAVYMWNDLVDLPIDRTEPRRAASPLVTGIVSPRAASAAAAIAAAAGLVIATASGGAALAFMAAALALLGVYDCYGKRTPVPPVIDLVQGVGWGALAAYGAAVSGAATAVTLWLGAYLAFVIVLVNGVLGALRDLHNDLAAGARTTAILFGARVQGDGTVVLPGPLAWYAFSVHAAGTAVLAVGIATTSPSTPRLVGLVAAGAGAAVLLRAILVNVNRRAAGLNAGFGYLVVMLVAPCLLVGPGIDATLAVPMAVLFAGPWVCSRWFRTTARQLLAARRRPALGR